MRAESYASHADQRPYDEKEIKVKAPVLSALIGLAAIPAQAQDLGNWTCRKLLATEYTSSFPFIGEYASERGVPGSNANATDYVLYECRQHLGFTVDQAIQALLVAKRRHALPRIPVGGA